VPQLRKRLPIILLQHEYSCREFSWAHLLMGYQDLPIQGDIVSSAARMNSCKRSIDALDDGPV